MINASLAVVIYGLLWMAQMVVPLSPVWVTIGGAHYAIYIVTGVRGPQSGPQGIQLTNAAAEVRCAQGGDGAMMIDAELSPVQQAKAMIHETVHIAETCDLRNLPLDERIARDVADLLAGAEGRFILREVERI